VGDAIWAGAMRVVSTVGTAGIPLRDRAGVAAGLG
jgi:hypothetical protein